MHCPISWALSSSTVFTASTRSTHVGGGSIIFSHSSSISRKQALTVRSSYPILWRVVELTPKRVPIVFQCTAIGSRSLNTVFNRGLWSIMIKMLQWVLKTIKASQAICTCFITNHLPIPVIIVFDRHSNCGPWGKKLEPASGIQIKSYYHY